MIQKLKNFFKHIKAYGFDHIFRSISWRTPRWLFYYDRSTHQRLQQVELDNIHREDYEIRTAEREDYALMSKMMISETVYKMRLDRGDVCAIAVKDSLVVALAWATFGKLFIRNAGAVMDTGKDGFYIYNAFTLESERRKGLHTALDNFLRHIFYARNRTTDFNSIDVYNQNSYKLHMKLGYKTIGNTIYFCLFGIKICIYRNWWTGKKFIIDIFIRKNPEHYIYV